MKRNIFLGLCCVVLVGGIFCLALAAEKEPIVESVRGLLNAPDYPSNFSKNIRALIVSSDKSEGEDVRDALVDEYKRAEGVGRNQFLLSLIFDKSLFKGDPWSSSVLADLVWEEFVQPKEKTNQKIVARQVLEKKVHTPSEANTVRGLVAEGRWDALQVAMKWGLSDLAPPFLDESYSFRGEGIVKLFPSYFCRDHFVGSDDEWYRQKLVSGMEHIYLKDFILCYRAWLGDEAAASEVKENYEKAPVPVGMRKPHHKDKRYWYLLACVSGQFLGEPPSVPVVY